MATIKIRIDTRYKSKDSLYRLQILVRNNTETTIKLPYRVKLEHFDKEKQIIIADAESYINVREANKYIHHKLSEIKAFINT
jgi:hypothetical protein